MNAFCVRTARMEGLLEVGMAKLGGFLPGGGRRVPSTVRWLWGHRDARGSAVPLLPAASFLPREKKAASAPVGLEMVKRQWW